MFKIKKAHQKYLFIILQEKGGMNQARSNKLIALTVIDLKKKKKDMFLLVFLGNTI